MEIYIRNPNSGCSFFMHLQERDALERRPLEMKHTNSSTLSHVVSEYYKVMEVYLLNPRSGCLFFMHLQEGDALERHPLEMKYTYPSTLDHVVSEYV